MNPSKRRSRSSSSSPSPKRRKRSKNRKKERKRHKSSSTSSSSSSNSDSDSSCVANSSKNHGRERRDYKHKQKKRRHSKAHRHRTSSSDSSSPERKKKKSKKKKSKKKKKKKHVTEKVKDDLSSIRKIESADPKPNVGPSSSGPAPRVMKPMTKEEWEKQQSVVRRVFDPETGRNRLVKGDGEIIEEIVSRDRHKQINQQATQGDGHFFQSKMGLLPK